MKTNKATARLAGFLYLTVVLAGIFSLLYVPSQLIVWDNAQQTLDNIVASERLFRLGIVSESISFTAFLLLLPVLYKLLHTVNKSFAVAMVTLALPTVPIFFSILLNKFAVLSLIDGVGETTWPIADQVMFYLRQFNKGNLIGQNFWALWLFPFGYLVFKSGFLPKVLGLILMIGSVGYYLNFLGKVALPNYSDFAISSYMTIPASIGEIGTCLWLVIMGAKEKTPKTL
ncbi:DUF4386 domain-containing protein [Muricauda sp. CAU 1633]|uniref:DUF4386 domain-containing protein n=1 Tax=Allomuricauda sp. CAU 1633 TaxID=2816036 RepID=UPI001A8C7E1C|nr:DUF4386 domain-containing protein [Muricauda sp. CAU 1633]MBO0321784.1 DUF4386 domain-containing protein [Muricauda sp. CAU 1633]